MHRYSQNSPAYPEITHKLNLLCPTSTYETFSILSVTHIPILAQFTLIHIPKSTLPNLIVVAA